jgi:hypothetical protein
MTRVVNPALMSSKDRNARGLLEVPNHLSFSQLTKLSPRYANSCPRSWAYNRLIGLPGGMGNGMILGRALDNAVTSFFQRRMIGDNPAVAASAAYHEIPDAILENSQWQEQKRPREDYVEMMSTAYTAFVDKYVAHIPASLQHDHVYEVATPPFGNTRMVGYSDWIDDDGVINDLKWSGSPKWDGDGVWYPDYVAQVRDQICTYYMGRLYAVRAGVLDATAPLVPRGRVVVVTGKITQKSPVIKTLDFEFTDALVAEIADAVREAVAVARAPEHPARPGGYCSFCPYLERCRNDSAVFAPTTESLNHDGVTYITGEIVEHEDLKRTENGDVYDAKVL